MRVVLIFSSNIWQECVQILHSSLNDITWDNIRKTQPCLLSDLSTKCNSKLFNRTVSGPQRGVPTESHVITHILEASAVSQLALLSLPTLLLSQWFSEHSCFFVCFLQIPNISMLLLLSSYNHYPMRSFITCWVEFPFLRTINSLFQNRLTWSQCFSIYCRFSCCSAWESHYRDSLWGFLTDCAVKQCWWL